MSLEYFTPLRGIVGGALIGLAAGTLLLFNGDILGASGLASSFVLSPVKTLTDHSQQWKLFFIVAFVATARIYLLADPDALKDERIFTDDQLPIVSPLGFMVGGFLVGFGTRLGNGCTTGHGICGMARFSMRSFAGVGAFMTTGVLTGTFFSPTIPGLPRLRESAEKASQHVPTNTTMAVGTVITSLLAGAAFVGLFQKTSRNVTEAERANRLNSRKKIIPSIAGAIFFSLGLVVSQMTLYSKIYGFLNFKLFTTGTWDPTLLCVMGGGFIVSFISYQWVKGFNLFKNSNALECPLAQKDGTFNVPTNKIIDYKLILGELIFGIGWGTAGLCPGPAMFLAFAGYPNVLLRWWPSFYVGSFLAELMKSPDFRNKLRKCVTCSSRTHNEPDIHNNDEDYKAKDSDDGTDIETSKSTKDDYADQQVVDAQYI